MNFSLIVPIAADKPEYEHTMPYLFNFDETGVLLCVKSIMGLDLSKFDGIYFVLLEKHNRAYSLEELFRIQFRRLGLEQAEVVSLRLPTSCQAETVYQTVRQCGLQGSIFIKDADNYFESEVVRENSVSICPLEALSMVNPQNKSYAAVDDKYYLTNIIEKKIISHYFNAGGTCFEKAGDFCRYYESLAGYGGHLYISHIIYAMLLDRISFRPFVVEAFSDWGDIISYKQHLNINR